MYIISLTWTEDIKYREKIAEWEVDNDQEECSIEVHDPGLIQLLVQKHDPDDQWHYLNQFYK